MTPDEARTAYSGKLVQVTVERWGEHEREIVEHPGAVAVLAVDVEGFVTLVRQRREAARRELLELPAGTLEPGEEALACARRELAEETGLHGGRWREVSAFFSTPGFCRERVRLFFADGVERGDAAPAGDERIDAVRWPSGEIEQRLDEIENVKTLVALLLYLHTVRK